MDNVIKALQTKIQELKTVIEELEVSIGPAAEAAEEPSAASARRHYTHRNFDRSFRMPRPTGVEPHRPRPGSIQSIALRMLQRDGARMPELISTVKRYERLLGVEEPIPAERRAFEILRRLHDVNGYGVEYDKKTKVIRVTA